MPAGNSDLRSVDRWDGYSTARTCLLPRIAEQSGIPSIGALVTETGRPAAEQA